MADKESILNMLDLHKNALAKKYELLELCKPDRDRTFEDEETSSLKDKEYEFQLSAINGKKEIISQLEEMLKEKV